MGDNRTGRGRGDDESIHIFLDRVPQCAPPPLFVSLSSTLATFCRKKNGFFHSSFLEMLPKTLNAQHFKTGTSSGW